MFFYLNPAFLEVEKEQNSTDSIHDHFEFLKIGFSVIQILFNL